MNKKIKPMVVGFLVPLIFLSAAAAAPLLLTAGTAASAGSFDSSVEKTDLKTDTSFGTSGGKNFTPFVGQGGKNRPYFIHEQLLKLFLVTGLTLAAVFLLIKKQYRYRKILLLASVILLGLLMADFLCPLTTLQNIFLRWNTGYLVLFGAGLILPTLLLGRVFCGYVCPFGALQELLHFKRIQMKVPSWLQRYLRVAKYALLVYVVGYVLVTAHLTLQEYTPFKAFFAFGGTPLAIALSIATAALSLIIWRPFCTYLCPLGAFLGLLSRVSIFKFKPRSLCTSCGACQKVCPAGAISLDKNRAVRVRQQECILCGECERRCPEGTFSIRKKEAEQKSARFCIAAAKNKVK